MKINEQNSNVSFKIQKLFFLTVNGHLPTVNGTAEIDENNLGNSSLAIGIPVANVNTQNTKRDLHLLQADFFDAEQFPEMTFSSSHISKKGNTYIANGVLSIAGFEKTIAIPFEFKNGIATGDFSIDRSEFKFGKIPAIVAANKVDISFEISLK
jgi:polyisoprenoid-binding protein YceI